jgi:anti-anti-sigma factor
MNLSTRRSVIGDINVLIVSGDVDLATIPQFTDALTQLLRDSRKSSAAVDLDEVRLLDDIGLGVLLGAAGRARTDGGELVVVVTNDKLRSRFAETRFDQAVNVRSTIADI